MNAAPTFYDKLDNLKGFSNAELLEHATVRQAFRWHASKYKSDDWEDLRQQAYIVFLRRDPVDPPPKYKFSRFLMVVIKFAVGQAYRWRHQKKRFLPAQQLPLCEESNRPLEPQGEQVTVLFTPEEHAQIRAAIQARVPDERQHPMLQVLEGVLDGETTRAIANRTGRSHDQCRSDRRRIREVLQAAVADKAAGVTSPRIVKMRATKRNIVKGGGGLFAMSTDSNRLRQLKRVLLVAHVVQLYPRSSASELQRILKAGFEYNDCSRTLSRDLNLLFEFGAIEWHRDVVGAGRSQGCRVYQFTNDLDEWPFPVAGTTGQTATNCKCC